MARDWPVRLSRNTTRGLVSRCRRCLAGQCNWPGMRFWRVNFEVAFISEQGVGEVEVGMADEIRQAPEAVRGQQNGLIQPLAELAARLERRPPQVVVTCARGSSAHAATFGKHLIERYIGLPVAAAAPNIASVYRQRLRLQDQLFLAISQSGRSDDLVELAISAKASGALTVAIVNATDGPLQVARAIFSYLIGAGPEPEAWRRPRRSLQLCPHCYG